MFSYAFPIRRKNIMRLFIAPTAMISIVRVGCLLALGLVMAISAPCRAAKPEARPVTDAAPLRLGIHNGLITSNAVILNQRAQTAADWIGGVLHRKVTYQINYGTGAIAQSLLSTGHFDLALVRPANLTAQLLEKGWTLIAMAHQPDQGVDFIGHSCPGKPGQVQIGGPSLALMGPVQPAPLVCVPASDVWKVPQARYLTAAKDSLIDQVTRHVVQAHGGNLRAVVNTSTQDAVADFLQTMHVAAIGSVTPVVAKTWVQRGGILIFHQSMPPMALLAAPHTSPEMISALRTAVLGAQDAAVFNRALQIPGWAAPDPQAYLTFLKWLRAPASAH
jgi:hypothetical protein